MTSTIRPLNIGPFELEMPVVQAALSGYSDWAMRVIARRLGAPYTICEVMLDKLIVEVQNGRATRRLLTVTEEEHPVGGQLMGADPEMFGPAAVRLVESGFDVIDINFGCPVKKVMGRCRGGFHLGQPSVALEIVSRVREAVPEHVPVTLKMRRGIDDQQESVDNSYQIFDGAFAMGAAAITVHGRTVAQRYIGPSDWNFLRDLKSHAPHRTVLGSGDLFSAQACLDMIEHTGVDGVTVARGAIGNPWIFREAAELTAGRPLPDPPSLFEQRDVIAEHYRLAEEIYGPVHACRQMRKFGIKYSQLHPNATDVRDAFVAVAQPGQWQEVLAAWYTEDLPGRRPPPPADHPVGAGAWQESLANAANH